MPLQTTEQIVAILKVTGGVLIVCDSDQTYGHLDKRDEALAPEVGVMAGTPSIVFATGTLPTLAVGKSITVGGVSYVVRAPIDVEPEGDGMVMRAHLREP